MAERSARYMHGGLDIHVERSFYADVFQFVIFRWFEDRRQVLLMPSLETAPEWCDFPEGGAPGRTFSLETKDAQRLLDELYATGLRPSQPTDQHEVLNAHLQDMRAIVSAKLNIELPQKDR